MVRTIGRRAVCVAAAVGGLFLSAGALVAEPTADFATVHDIMSEGHKGKKSLLSQIKEGVKAEKWDDIAKAGKTLKQYGEDLGKNTPEKGEAESWKKLSESYKKTMLAIAEGIEKKDAKATNKALTEMNNSCKSCHSNHR